MDIGKRIAQLRKERNWTQLELAGKLFVTDKAVSKWEQGIGSPELQNIVSIAKIFGVTTDYLLTGEGHITEDEKVEIDEHDEIMQAGEFVEAKTHAQFLNTLLNKKYSGYMKCVYNFDTINLLWMIRLDSQVTSTGWCNTLEDNGNKIIEDYVAPTSHRSEHHKKPVFHQIRYVFDIVDGAWGKRKYIFRGVFKFSREEGNNDYRVWNKISDTANFKELLNK